MATIRERDKGVWEVRVFIGRDAKGRPTQLSRTVRGSKREAQLVAASLEAGPSSKDAGRTVAEVLAAWQDVNADVWAPASRRDYAGRIRFIAKDPIASMRLARLGVADVERWHARMRRAGVGETAIRGRHSALRAALSQAVRLGWIGANPAMAARLRQPRQAPRTAMSTDDVHAVIAAAAAIDPAAALALRLAAAAGLRRAELAALRWDDLDGDRLTVDSSVARHTGEAGASVLVDAPTKTANRRVVRLDADTVAATSSCRTCQMTRWIGSSNASMQRARIPAWARYPCRDGHTVRPVGGLPPARRRRPHARARRRRRDRP